MFSYDHLLAFCATYEEQGYSAAAKKLGKDRTTIRDQVKALEESYDVALFNIVGKKATPTPAAQHVYQRAKSIIANTKKLNQSLCVLHQEDLASITVYHDISLPLELALKIEHAMGQKFPEVKLHWLHRNRDEAFAEIEQTSNSIAIMQHRHRQSTQQAIEFVSLGYGKLSLYTGARSTLRHLNNLTAEDLKLAKQYISENHFNILPEMFAISPHYHLVSNNDLLITLLKYDGWAILSTELAQTFVAKGELYELDIAEVANQFSYGLSLFYSAPLETHPMMEVIKSICKQHFTHQ
ncbi:LysR family transcriptional regulator [Vibrio sp. CAU 1672]|uniref:LysR family transcriptional regulator n=1 Tax=Vibrio sp. CAU 1672 TaxID=3032594 RepID=UPI0023DB3862|nr:LysR family transcriptional regulator [Vibrio sp. CAU 1672]MDF2154630.1 LysR family transcriptional regulator [Vibrio sp. CAU 1672]